MAKKLGERLVEAGLITPDAVQKALEHQKITGHRLGDCLVEIGLLQETALLRFLAAELQTRFVSADKLAKAKVPTEVLDKVPVRMAEAQNVLPLAYDPERRLLSVVAAEPQNKAMLDELALLAGVAEVYAYVGVRSAIAAAIKKHYYGDPTAFSSLEAASPQALRSDVSAMAGAYESSGGSNSAKVAAPSLQLRLETDPRLKAQRLGGMVGGTQVGKSAVGTMVGASRSTGTDNDYVETLNVLVSLLEQGRKYHRGHSAQLARQATVVARRMGLSPRDVLAIAMAAYLHDLGKPPDKHFCLASNAVNPDWKAEAKRYCRAPVKLFETVHLPVEVNTILAQLYEAYDGSGTPQGAKGEEIVVGSRILAAVDSYLELTKDPANTYGRVFTKDEALAHLKENAGRLYDPVVADHVCQMQSGELLRQRLVHEGRQILIADPDEGVRTDLLEAVQRRELIAHALAGLEGAYDALTSRDYDVLVIGLKFGLQEVLGLMQVVRSTPETAGLPVIVVGEPDAASQERLTMGGAAAIVSTSDPDKAASAIQASYEARIFHGGPAHVVRGGLDELPLMDLLKLLGAGRKSGRLYLKYNAHEGYLHVERGRVTFATIANQMGDQALQTLLGLKQADFRYDPDSLLLEMPQMDKDLEMLVKAQAVRKPPAPGDAGGGAPRGPGPTGATGMTRQFGGTPRPS